ncbi:hypothetical protein D9613_004553 [Agrocybe pediades]|uniref:F-box domain-containing protein n=1 Tax=Agrocybe pediades TaxID=84607 RepID=A0A8H4QJC7_9AGAR|nr:hypothetical protein D9613_004553 [Agrocybe pediades]
MSQKWNKCLECNNCDAIHTSVLNDAFSACPSGIQQCDACGTVTKLKSEVEETMERLKNLLMDLRHAKMEMNYRHSSILKKFPTEILSSIFESSMTVSDQGPRSNCGVRKTPLVLSQVCRNWRQVALETPLLWTRLAVIWDGRAEGQLDRVHEWIARTRGFPLDIFLGTSCTASLTAEDCPQIFDSLSRSEVPFLQAIASTSAQWRVFSASVPYCVLEYLGQHVQDVALLEELDIDRLWSKQVSTTPIWSQCQPAPKSVELDDCPPRKMNIRWDSVTTMTVGRISTEDCLTLLSSSPDLTTCHFYDIKWVRHETLSQHMNQPAIKHEKIQNFTYEYSSSSPPSFLFHRLELPNIRSFACSWSVLDEMPQNFFGSMLKLEELKVSKITCDDEAKLSSTLSNVPGTVTRLFLACDSFLSNEEEFGKGEPRDSTVHILRIFDQTAVIDTNSTASSYSFILPNLTFLEIKTPGRVDIPWSYVPRCYGPVGDDPGEHDTVLCRRRPLTTIRILDEMGFSFERKGKVFIPSGVLKELVTLQQKGAEIVYQNSTNGDDLFRSAIVDAGLDRVS